MPLNAYTVVIEFDVADVREVCVGKMRKVYAGGAHFERSWLAGWTSHSIEIRPNTCDVRISANGGKAAFCFNTTVFIVNLHHVERIYEKESNDVLWQKGGLRHIVIQFAGRVVLIEKNLPIGSAVFFDAHNGIDTNWIVKCNGRLVQNHFMMLKPICKAYLLNKVVVIHIDKEEVRIPTDDLVEVYEKETGRKIWPVTAKANP